MMFSPGGNSGAGAIALADLFGARRVILLGYDCKTGRDGRRHWHGDHPSALKNAGSLPRWPDQFEKMARRMRHLEIINATRDTALTMWPRMDLEKALNL
ncbi:hypothetical protein Q2E61_09245 [Microbulbifer thermotolerans]|uniref:hypothetical protein n=1 Tax=Microbulbifer thermotolerans TaxID=252514 RepID=UPI002671CB52|nr:hypothetical protein [Microbulbifer thermotolerans]WKT59112.1 hypothetical protein Q2E61_09245 [Microbulbifer thermotolerans]